MEVIELEAKVAKAAEKVEKCKGTIARHEAQKAKKLAALTKQGVDVSNLDAAKDAARASQNSELSWAIYEAQNKDNDIKGATRKLSDAETILSNWEVRLGAAIEKERFLEGNAPQVIKDFMEQWKAMAIDWCIKRYDNYLIYSAKLDAEVEAAELAYWKATPEYARFFENGELRYRPNNFDNKKDKYLKENGGLDYASVKRKKAEYAGGTVMTMLTYRDEQERLAWLEKVMEAEKKAKMFDLINRIHGLIGAITDAQYLRISPKGNLDGYVDGENGRAKVETIGAGGYNIQIFHFRTLVHKLKGE
jgi:hypothetical protein